MANPDTPSKAAATDGQPHQLTLPVVPNVAVALTKLIAILIKEYGEAQLTATTTYEMYCRRLGVNTKVVACKAYDVFQHGVDNAADSADADALLIYDPADANRPYELADAGSRHAFYRVSADTAVFVSGSSISRQTLVIGPPAWPLA